MKRMGIVIALLLLLGVQPARMNAFSQDDSERANTVTAHIKISVEGLDKVPMGSKVELKGDPEKCKDVHRTQTIQSNEVTLMDIQKCRIDLLFFIPGLDSQVLSVDFATYKDPLRIVITARGVRTIN